MYEFKRYFSLENVLLFVNNAKKIFQLISTNFNNLNDFKVFITSLNSYFM